MLTVTTPDHKVGLVGVEPIPLPGPKPGRTPRAPPEMFRQSERQDLNLRSPGSRPGAITRLRHVLIKLSKHPVGESNSYLRIEKPRS